MTMSFAASMRRATRLTRAGKPVAATKAIQRAIGGAMVRPAMASIKTLAAMGAGKPKTARKPRKAAVRVARKRKPASAPRIGMSLSAVLEQLKAARARLLGDSRSPVPSTPPRVPAQAQYLSRNHVSAAGSRDFKLFLPSGQRAGPKGLIVMLHGCTQDPDSFATGTDMNSVAGKHGLAVAYPAQTRRHNAASCWNWFAPVNQSRGAGEPAVIASLARSLMREFDLDRNAVFVAGLSAGGAMAVILADTYPDVFSAAGVHSGLPRGSASDVVTALSVMRSGAKPKASAGGRRKAAARPDRAMRRIIFQGDADDTVHPSNAPQIVVAAVGAREPARITPKSAAGRDYVRSVYVLPDGSVDVEFWEVKGAGHAWSGGKSGGSYTDPEGPDASTEMVRFFLRR